MIVKGVVEGGANTVMLVALGPDGRECGGSWEVPIDMFLVVCQAASAELVTLKSRITQLEYIAEWAQKMHAMANEVRHQVEAAAVAAVTDPQIAPMAQMAVEGPPDPLRFEVGRKYRVDAIWIEKYLRPIGPQDRLSANGAPQTAGRYIVQGPVSFPCFVYCAQWDNENLGYWVWREPGDWDGSESGRCRARERVSA